MAGFLSIIIISIVIQLQPTTGHNPHDVVGALGASPEGNFVFAIVRRVLFRSANGGLNWDLSNRGITGMDTSADGVSRTVAVSPAFGSDHTVFLNNAGGVFRSIDQGLSWENVLADEHMTPGHAVIALSPNFAADKKMLVAASAGLLRSQDGGNSFTEVSKLSTPQCLLLAMEKVVFMASVNGDIAWSLDFGDTWGSADLKGLTKETDLSFISISDIVLDPQSAFFRQPDSLEEGWEVASLLLGGLSAAHVMVFAYKPGGSADDFHVVQVVAAFKSLPRPIAKVGAAVLPGATYSTAFVLPSSGPEIVRADDLVHYQTHRVIKEYADLGSDWQDQATALHANTLSYFTATSGALFLGTFCGLHKSIDGGVNWVKLDVESRRITQMVVAPAPPSDSAVPFAVCTYGDGCFGGNINIDQLKKGNAASAVSDYVHWNEERYCTMAFSPNYKNDGIVMRRCATDVNVNPPRSTVWRSTDHGKSFAPVELPLQNQDSGFKNKPAVFTMAFSPSFDEDSTVFVSGVNMGLLISQDEGRTFTLLNNFDGRAVKVYVSPDFGNDRTLLVLATYLYHGDGMSFSDFSAWRGDDIIMSRDAGESWSVQRSKTQLESVSFSPSFATDGTIIGLRMIDLLVTRLVVSSDRGNHWNDVNPGEMLQDFGRGGVAVGHLGHVVASYLEGGVAVGPLKSLALGNQQGFFAATADREEMPFSFVQDTDDELDVRVTGSMVAFSPNGQVMFGASFYSLYASLDYGSTWKVIFKVQHTDSDCDVANCDACHLKDHRECISCRAGFHPNALEGGCDSGSGLSLIGFGARGHSLHREPQTSASRWYVELISILSVVTLAGYAIVCRIWAFYACKQHKQNAEGRKGAKDIYDTVAFGAAC